MIDRLLTGVVKFRLSYRNPERQLKTEKDVLQIIQNLRLTFR